MVCFFKRFELSIAVERLEQFERRPRLLVQHMIAKRFDGSDERLVSRALRTIREKIETELKI
jgi:hypothetical protein